MNSFCVSNLLAVYVGDDFYAYITHTASGKALAVDSNKNVVIDSYSGDINQIIHFMGLGDGSYKSAIVYSSTVKR